MAFFLKRSRPHTRRFLEWKVRIFGVAAVLALAGIAMDEPWLVSLAIAILAVGFLLTVLPRGTSPDRDRDEGDDADSANVP